MARGKKDLDPVMKCIECGESAIRDGYLCVQCYRERRDSKGMPTPEEIRQECALIRADWEPHRFKQYCELRVLTREVIDPGVE